MEGCNRSTCRQLDFTLGINMAGHASRQHARKQEANSRDRPQKEERDYITEEQVRHVRNQRPVSSHLLRKYQYQYQQRLQCETEEEEYERRTGKCLRKWEDTRDHWHCPFFKYCWDSGIKRLPILEDCPECNSQKQDARSALVFQRLGPEQPRQRQAESTRTGEIQKMRKTSITDHASALMGLTGPRSGGCSGCTPGRSRGPIFGNTTEGATRFG
jgi:hypothetical protein